MEVTHADNSATWRRVRGAVKTWSLTLCVLGIGLLTTRPADTAPAEPLTSTPFSWPSFKQSPSTAINVPLVAGQVTTQFEGLPGTPTISMDTFSGDTVSGSGGLGTQLPGFLIGDIGNTPPPFGTNIFRDTNQVIWTSPHYSVNGGSAPTTNVTVDNADGTSNFTSQQPNPPIFLPATIPWTPETSPGTAPHTSAVTGTTDYAVAPNAGVGNAATATADYNLNVPYPGQWSLYEWHPVQHAGESYIHDAHFTLEENGVGVDELNPATPSSPTKLVDQTVNGGQWVKVAGPYLLPASGGATAITVHEDNSTADTLATVASVVVADAVQLRPDGLTVDNPVAVQVPAATWSLQPTTAQEPDNFGGDYLRVAPVDRPQTWQVSTTYAPGDLVIFNGVIYVSTAAGTGHQPDISPTFWSISTTPASTQAEYTPTVPSGGLYSVYAWFPSQNTSATGTELHVTDAEYTINTNGLSFVTHVDQSSGGRWAFVGGPFYFPEGNSSFISIDNTTGNGVSPNQYVIADAIQLRSSGEDSSLFGSPAAVEATNYPELFTGYAATNNSTDEVGGGIPQYLASHVNPDKSNDITHTDLFAGTTTATATGVSTSTTTTGTSYPLKQLVYYTRTEQVLTPTGGTQTVGAIYCVDGANGNTVWRYPGANVTNGNMLPASISSTPLVLRNVVVRVSPAGEPGDHYDVRTVVVAGDNNGKLFCLDAAGNGDGDDTVIDHTRAPVSFDSTGQPIGSPAAPLTYRNPGTTQCYWVWQPNSSSPLARSSFDNIVDDSSAVDTNTVDPTISGAYVSSGFGSVSITGNDAFPDVVTDFRISPPAPAAPYTRTYATAPAVPASTPIGSQFFATWEPNLSTTTTAAKYAVSVWYPSPTSSETHVNAAQYTVYDNTGAAIVADPVDQTTRGGQWVPLLVGGNPLIVTMDATGSSATKNSVVLSNATSSTLAGGEVVVGDAVRIESTSPFKPVEPNNDLIAPGSFQMNSATASLQQIGQMASGAFIYSANIFVGNSNGVLYSLDASGVLNNPAILDSTGRATSPPPYTATDFKTYDLSVDPTVPTVNVNWWFATGEGINSSPVYDANTNRVLVTTYDPNDENHGRVYAVNADIGPVGNAGQSYNSTTKVLQGPGSYQYNVKQIPVWSFPDRDGTVTDAVQIALPAVSTTGTFATKDPNGTQIGVPIGTFGVTSFPVNSFINQGSSVGLLPPLHLIKSLIAGPGGTRVGALPLGDIAGAPMIYTYPVAAGSSTNETRIFFGANEPTVTEAGRIYAITEDGSFDWAYPMTHATAGNPAGDPNGVRTVVDQVGPASGGPGVFTANLYGGNPLTSGAFSAHLDSPSYFVGSSPSAAMITFPASLPASQTALAETQVPMLYFGNLGGFLTALNLQGTNDVSRLIYNEPIGDASPIFSTPAVLGGSSQDLVTGVKNIGGVVFVTTGSGDLLEVEATPYVNTLTGTTIVNTDVDDSGLGALSSPALAGFNALAYATHSGTYTGPLPVVNTNDIEFVYCGNDAGIMNGITGAVVIAGGGGTYVDTGGDLGGTPPPPGTPVPTPVNLVRNFVTAISYDNSTNTFGDSTIFTPVKAAGTGQPAKNPVFDWGQTVYLKIYGLDDPNASGATDNTVTPAIPHPKLINVTFTLTTLGVGNKISRTDVRTIAPQQVVAYPGSFIADLGAYMPPTSPTVQSMGNFVGTFAYQLGNGDGVPQTPGAKVILSNVQETVLIDGETRVYRSHVGTAGLQNTNPGGTPNLVETTPIDQATFGILNPIAIRGAALRLNGSAADNLFKVPGNNAGNIGSYQSLGPFKTFDAYHGLPPFADYAFAATNGNDVPQTEPYAGTITTTSGGTIDVTQFASTQTAAPVYYQIVVATGLGMVGDGATGDSGTLYLYGGRANPANDNSAAPVPNQDYGLSFLDVADRSYLGAVNNNIDRIRMDSTRFGWNDNSGQQGPGSVINPLPWEAFPTAYTMGGSNTGPDYPDIPRNHTTVELVPINPLLDTSHTISPHFDPSKLGTTNGSNTIITDQGGVLANSNGTGGATPRTVNVNPVLISLDINKYQPANMEAIDGSTNLLSTGVNRLSSNGNYVPNGYVATAHIFVDSNGNGRFARTDAYRDLQVWVNVPADMSTTVVEPTVDVGSVPAGFGNQNPVGGVAGKSTLWTPYKADGSSSFYAPWFRSITVQNHSNVNLINVHMDQAIAGGSTDGNSNPLPPYLPFVSDSVEKSSFIPSLDRLFDWTHTNPYTGSAFPNVDGALFSASSGGGDWLPIMRSSMDFYAPLASWTNSGGTQGWGSDPLAYFNTYRPNINLLDSSGVLRTPGPTAHKPRVLDNDKVGVLFSVPDEPHDGSSHPMFDASSGQPKAPQVSIAIPMGTPVGTYSQTVRLFEGVDYPYDIYTGPTYNQKVSALEVQGGTPQQPVSEPGFTLKLNVIEKRMTKGSFMAGPPAITGSTITTPLAAAPDIDANDTQVAQASEINPWAFYTYINSTTQGVGLVWQSGRGQQPTTFNASQPFYDILGTGMTVKELDGQITQNSGGVKTTLPGWASVANTQQTRSAGPPSWWSDPTPLTASSPGPVVSSSAYDPFVVALPHGSAPAGVTHDNTALWVEARVDRSSGSPITSYRLRAATFDGITFPSPGGGSVLVTSTTPIFHPRGMYIGPYLVLFWTSRASSRNTINTMVYNPQLPAVGANGQPTPSQGQSTLLPIAPGLSELQEPVPVLRDLTSGASNDPVIDLTFSGKSEVSGTTDIYTSRYVVTNRVTGTTTNPASQWKLQLIPFGRGVTDILTSDERQVIWKGRDIEWVRDPSRFLLMNGNLTAIPLGLAPTSIDTVTGLWTYPVSNIPGVTTALIDPRTGVVEFTTQPKVGAITRLTATVAAQAIRISSGSLSSSQPTVFIDDALKPNAAPSAADSSGFPAIPPVQTSRYWYIFRKSASGSGTAASTSSTLYYNTRRLSIVLNPPMSLDSTHNMPLPQVMVAADASMSGSTDISTSVDIDWKRSRINFPERFEGMYATVTYVSDYTAGTPPSPTMSTVGPAVIQWLDEPYVNDPAELNAIGERPVPISNAVNESSPSALLDPGAYATGPDASHPQSFNPHRVWLFWSSARNTYKYRPDYTATAQLPSIRAGEYVADPASSSINQRYYVAKVNAPTDDPFAGPSPQWAPYFGSNDLYWEALDPRFEISYP